MLIRGKIFLVLILLVMLLMLVPYLPWLQPTTSKQAEYAETGPDELIENTDTDSDLLSDNDELYVSDTDPYTADTDNDGMPDGEEYNFWTDKYKNAPDNIPDWLKDRHPILNEKELKGQYKSSGDLDGDGIPNIRDRDSDGDGLPDGFEKQNGLDPADPNSNFESLSPALKNYILSGQYSNNDLQKFGDKLDLNYGNSMKLKGMDFNDIVFKVSPSSNPRYWRTTVFDKYSKGAWDSELTDPETFYTGVDLEFDVEHYISKQSTSYTITFEGKVIGTLPTALHTSTLYSITPSSDIEYSSVGTFESQQQVKNYSFNATIFEYDEDKLIEANAPSEIDNYNTIEQSQIPSVIKDLGMEIAAGAGSDFEKASAIAKYLLSNYIYDLYSFEYNLNYPLDRSFANVKGYDKALVNMLFNTYRGHCVDFSSAFVLMCRSNGIPAQLVTGFAPGELEYENPNTRVVRMGHNHAWAEVLLDGFGWVPFEVTPNRAIHGNTTGVSSAGVDTNMINHPHGVKDNATDYEFGGNGGGTTSHLYIDLWELVNHPKIDSDRDGIKNDKDSDDDNDGLTDEEELELGTDPFRKDTDKDGLSDFDEVREYNTKPTDKDTDNDGLSDYYEVKKSFSDPLIYDTDGGGAYDGLEVVKGGDPNDASDDDYYIDSDKDGLTDGEEADYGTDPNKKDTDGGGANDKLEHIAGLNPVDDPEDDLGVLDSDNDGLMDERELEIGTDRFRRDSDSGGVGDGTEYNINYNYDYDYEFDLLNGSDDFWLKDNDGDGLSNIYEKELGTDMNDSDTDDGGINDGDEIRYGTDPLSGYDDSLIDTDGDKISDLDEKWGNNTYGYTSNPYKADSDNDGITDYDEIYVHYTDPNNPDSDGDGLSDGFEIKVTNTQPNDQDTDNDGLSDWEELQWFTDPNDGDTDGDGLDDGIEVETHNSNPTLIDTDGDGLADKYEIDHNSDPLMWDTDGDGFTDFEEIEFGSSPIKDYDFPKGSGDGSGKPFKPETPYIKPDPGDHGYEPNPPDIKPPSNPGTGSNTPSNGGLGGGNIGNIWFIIIGLILIVIIGLYYLSWRHQHIEEIAEVAERAEKQLTSIKDTMEADSIRLAIFEAYKSMLKVMQRYDFVREPSMTPAEFRSVIANALPITDKNINALTVIFEEARYSDHKLNTKIRDEAITSFRELKNELRGVRRGLKVKDDTGVAS